MDMEKIYTRRFNVDERAALAGVWKVLVDHALARWIGPDAAVLDLGAGYCNFINQVSASRRIAVDANPTVATYCAPGVRFVHAADLRSAGLEGTLDVVFMSNFLEHLDNADAVLAILRDVHALLKPGGRAIILQPNFVLVGPAYFDFLDHKMILTDQSLVEALELAGFHLVHLRRRFLPYTSKSSIPSAPWMVRLYLMIPLAQWLMGKQTLAIAEKRD